jgi:hypothetical protein
VQLQEQQRLSKQQVPKQLVQLQEQQRQQLELQVLEPKLQVLELESKQLVRLLLASSQSQCQHGSDQQCFFHEFSFK